MQLQINNTLEDWIALNKYLHVHSLFVRRQVARSRWRRFIAVCAVVAGGGLVSGSWLSALVAGAILAILLPLLVPFVERVQMRRSVAKLYTEYQKNDEGKGHTVEIVPDGLKIRSGRGESTLFWDSVESVATSKEHTFIIFGLDAVVIPHRDVPEATRTAFLREIELRRVQNITVPAAKAGGWWRQ